MKMFIRSAIAFLAAISLQQANAEAVRAYPFCIAADCGLIDRAGNWLVKPRYSKLVPSGPYWVAERASGLVGLLDAQGKVLIPPSLRDIGEFVDGLAPAQGRDSENYGYIDTSGKWVIEPRYFGARPFQNGIAQVIHNPKNGAHLTTEFIDIHGKRAIPREFLVSGSSSSTTNGLSLVEVAAAGDETHSALIDQRGRYIVPPRKDQNILLEKDGSIVVRRGEHQYLVDSHGKTLLEVSGEEALIRSAGEGIAFFERPGQGVGLVDAQTGRIIIPPQRNWVWVGEFNEGLANLRVLLGNGDLGEGYIDRRGKIIIQPHFRGASPFRGGLAIASEADGRDGLIDRSGNWWRKPANGQSFHSMSDDEIQGAAHLRTVFLTYREATPFAANQPARDYSPENAEQVSVANLPIISESLDGPQPLASVRRHPCGIEIAVNARGERTWPEHLVGPCAAEQLSRVYGDDESQLSPQARTAYLDEKKRRARAEAERNHEVRQRDKRRGGIAEMATRYLYPAMAERDKRLGKLIEEAGWLRGEQALVLHGPVRINLPAGIKLLLPEKVVELREKIKAEKAIPLPPPPGYVALQEKRQAGTISAEEFATQEKRWQQMFPEAFAKPAENSPAQVSNEIVLPTAMIADEEERWQASLTVVASGYLALEENALPAPDELTETLSTYGFWRNTGGIGLAVTGHSSYEWLSPLRLEQPGSILSWAYKYFEMYTGKSPGEGFRHGAVANMIVPGRSHLVQVSAYWDGPTSESLAESYFPEILAIAHQISFEPGQGYADYVAGEKRVQIPVKYLITGAPPESLQRFSSNVQNAIERAEQEKQEKIMERLLRLVPVVLALLAVFFGANKHRKGKGTSME